ncbi:hypothetical protein M8998_05980 [Sphingobacterium sp. lm-10]|uniref:hypothetical protein n=1 Tax=Sphingobacterium sp. lm-10 TaxID=2944904 RepID=UPI002022821C|nr:hypothetical protein [Sphingobacterium sp. lm-10]MCL7987484.1 hypothetical protein [Sphingobacterium sp. lm-10]
MGYNRKFSHSVNGDSVEFDVTYNTENHYFTVLESGLSDSYLLKFDMATRTWSTDGGAESKIAAEDLAILVQKHFGRSV